MKVLIRRVIRSLGFDLRRYNPACSQAAQLMQICSIQDVNLVFDVGANTGQFGSYLREAGYRGRIISFEPLTSARQQLMLARKNDPFWEVAPQAALGDEDGEIVIHVAGNSVSSSVLNMLDSHTRAAPESAYISSERVPLRRLDTLAPEYLRASSNLFVKIDTQGYEDRVLDGASEVLPHVSVLQLELSLVPLYEGQRLFDEMISKLKTYGFELWAISPVLIDTQTGRLLQIDATLCASNK